MRIWRCGPSDLRGPLCQRRSSDNGTRNLLSPLEQGKALRADETRERTADVCGTCNVPIYFQFGTAAVERGRAN